MAFVFFGLISTLSAPSWQGDHVVAVIPEGVEPTRIAFSDNGDGVAYTLWDKKQFWVVAGDWKSEASPAPLFPILRPAGKLVYAVFTGGEKLPYVSLKDRVLFTTTQEWSWGLPGAISADGSIVVSPVHDPKSDRAAVALNGKVQKIHAGIAAWPVISENGKVFAFALEKKDGHCMVVNDNEGPVFDWVTDPVLTPDGNTVAYGAESGDHFLLIRGNDRLSVKASPKGAFISRNGQAIGCWITTQKGGKRTSQVLIGEKMGPEFTSIVTPTFTLDGKHVAYRAEGEKGKRFVVIDDQIIPVGDIQTSPVFVDGDKKVGYGVREGRELWWRFIEVK